MLRLWHKWRDRRSLLREELLIQARLWVVEALTQGRLTTEHPVRVVNLSEGGCCLALPTLALEGMHLQRCLNCGEDYLVELELALPGGGTWRLVGEVLWTNRAWEQEAFAFRLGLRFVGPVALPQNWKRLVGTESGA